MSKASTYSEVDAMRDVDAALSQLESDARHRVMHWALSKHGADGATAPAGTEVSARFSAADAHRPKDIKSFLSQKRPDSFYERVACLVYYLEKFDGQPEVGTNDITKANSDARLSKLTNPAVFVKHATHTYGYLISVGKRKFAISARGEAVVEALPDRAKVEEIHSRIPFGRKARKAAKK